MKHTKVQLASMWEFLVSKYVLQHKSWKMAAGVFERSHLHAAETEESEGSVKNLAAEVAETKAQMRDLVHAALVQRQTPKSELKLAIVPLQQAEVGGGQVKQKNRRRRGAAIV
jgi:hypothetical protein